MTRSALIIGLGRIAWRGFGDAAIETHAQTIMDHEHLRLVGGVDIEPQARNEFQCRYGVAVYDRIDFALAQLRPSIVVICTPPDQHVYDVVAAAKSADAILCEKPLAASTAAARECVIACRGKTLLVGHQRRYEARHRALREFIRSGVLGEPVAAASEFSGGWLNNGSHAADTLRYLVGDDVPKSLNQGSGFSVRVACRRGAIELSSRGDLHPGYMRAMYDDLLSCMETGNEPICNGEDGREAVRLALAAEELRVAA